MVIHTRVGVAPPPQTVSPLGYKKKLRTNATTNKHNYIFDYDHANNEYAYVDSDFFKVIHYTIALR